MARKAKDKGAVSEPEKSPEFQKFEAFAKEVLSVPKTEIDRREAEWQKRKQQGK